MSGEKLVQETPKGTTLTEPVSDLQNAAKKIQEGRAHEFTPEELDSVGAFEYDNAETDALDRALGNTLEKNEADWADMGGKTTTATKNLNTEQIDELLGGKVKK